MRVILALLLALSLCVVNAGNIRARDKMVEFVQPEAVKRSPRFAFHSYETQAKGDDGESDESFVSMLPESMFIELGGTSNDGGEGAGTGAKAAPASEVEQAASSGASGNTGSTGGTGSTGATGMTGATASTGMTGNDEEPQETKDQVLNGQMLLGGVVKANFGKLAHMKFIKQLASLLEIPKDKVIINSVAETTGPAATAAASRRRLLEDGGGVIVDFSVSEISESEGKKIIQTLETRASDLVGLLSQQGLPFSTLTSVVAPKEYLHLEPIGKGTNGGCHDKVLKKIVEIKATGGTGADLPTHLKSFCNDAFAPKKKQLNIDDKVVKSTCSGAHQVVENIKVQDRFGKPMETAVQFCTHMRKFFEKLVASQAPGPMSFGVASSVSEINKESPGNGITSCCTPHKVGKGCYDKAIQDCVCSGKGGKLGKKDAHCCEHEWDLTCTENVEWFHCAGCPQEPFFGATGNGN